MWHAPCLLKTRPSNSLVRSQGQLPGKFGIAICLMPGWDRLEPRGRLPPSPVPRPSPRPEQSGRGHFFLEYVWKPAEAGNALPDFPRDGIPLGGYNAPPNMAYSSWLADFESRPCTMSSMPRTVGLFTLWILRLAGGGRPRPRRFEISHCRFAAGRQDPRTIFPFPWFLLYRLPPSWID
jgi:hypothetical protein